MKITLCTLVATPFAKDRISQIASRSPHDEFIVVNHSSTAIDIPGCRCFWRNGYNEYYGGGLNFAAKMATGDAFVYISSNRAVVEDPTWVDDVVAPLADPRCGMAGCLASCSYDRIARVPTDVFPPQIHIQGGAFAIRTEVLRRHPYGTRFPQVFSDVWISWSLIRSGYELIHVPSISCSAGAAAPSGKVRVGYAERDMLEQLFNEYQRDPEVTRGLLSTLRHYAAQANRIVEFTDGRLYNTVALLSGFPSWMRTFTATRFDTGDIPELGEIDWEVTRGEHENGRFDIADLLFLCAVSDALTVTALLNRHARRVSRWIIIACASSPDFTCDVLNAWLENQSEFSRLAGASYDTTVVILERVRGYPDV